MAVLIATGFEDYANGNASLTSNGWVFTSDDMAFGAVVHVISSVAHGGSKSVQLGDAAGPITGPGSLERTVGDGTGRSFAADLWVYTRSAAAVPTGHGLALLLYHMALDGSNGTGIVDRGVFGPHPPAAEFHRMRVYPNPDGTPIDIEGVFNPDVWQRVRVEWFFSSVNDDHDDVLNDGCLRVSVDGVQKYAGSGLKVYATTAGFATGVNSFDYLQMAIDGYVDDVSLTNDVVPCGASTSNVPPPNSAPCCADKCECDGPGGNPGPGPGVPDDTPLPPWVPQCAGGGDVPTAADVTNSEDWTL